jgi:FtsH-binding integral membrane protein
MPGYWGGSGTPSYLRPSPGLRIVLLVALALDVGLTGLLMLTFLIASLQPDGSAFDFTITFAFAVLFGLAVTSLVGVAIRATWSRWLAIASGILISWTVIGLLLGVPIVVTAARAPDLTPPR